MKILYVGTDAHGAQAIATALNGLGERVMVSWTSGVDQVAKWIGENDGARVLVVEAQPQGPDWRSVLTYAAGLPTALPVVVIVPDGTASYQQALGLDSYERIIRNPSLLRDLPAVITRAIDRARQRQTSTEASTEGQRLEKLEQLVALERAARADLELELVRATATNQEAEQRHQSAMAAAAEQLTRSQSQFALGMARAAATREMVDEQFREAATVVERMRRIHAAAAADAERLACRETELSALLDEANTTRSALERRLADAETARREGEARTAEERRTVASTTTAAAAQLRELQAALNSSRQEVESKAAHVAALATREAELTSMLAAATTSRETIERRLAAVEAARQETDARAIRELLAAGTRAAEREAELDREIRRERVARTGLEKALADARTALDDVRREHQSAVADVTRLTEREAEIERRLEEEHATRVALEQAVADAAGARRDEQQRHAATLATAAGELAERQKYFDRERAQADVERAGLAAQLREVEAARDQARGEHQSAVADVTRLTEREAEIERRLEEEHTTRVALEQAVAEAAAARRDEQQRHAATRATAAGELAERQMYFDRERAQADMERAGLAAQLREVESARDEARREHQSVIADLTRLSERAAAEREAVAARQTDLDARLSRANEEIEALQQTAGETRAARLDAEGRLEEERAVREGLEQEVRNAAAAWRDEQEQHATALAKAAGELAELQAYFDGYRAQAEAERTALTAQLRTMEEARDEVRREHQSAIADVTRLTGRAADEREGAAAREADLEARLSWANEKIEALEQTVAETRGAGVDAERRLHEETHALQAALRASQEESDRLDREHRVERDRLEQAITTASAANQQLAAERHEIERRLDEVRSGSQDSLDRLTREHASALAARDNDIRQLRVSLAGRVEELEVAKRHREVLQADADQLPGLRQELHQSRADNHRLFQQAPLPMFRCTKDGVLTQANRLLALLVGHRWPDDLRGPEFAAAVFESPNDLSWLIERCLGSRGKESTETTWRRKDGIRLLVRLSACATSSDLIECGVEDLTPVRVLKDRLGEAHRMEAVGRLAAEVAVTCGNLLRGIHQDAQQWLMTDGSPTASRQQRGEMMLEEISRASGLLRQLAAYGDEESRRPAMVELSTVVRDIAPVLKRVAGDGVDVELPAASAPLNVDAGAECVERLLVNVAAYGRKRMPAGGRLKIELGTIVVDRHFTAKHPNVRLGRHALVTVTESRRTTRTDGLLQLHDNEGRPSSQSSAPVQTSVDLETLQELVGACGGHLWMTVQPLGDMVIKIRLPLLTPYGQPPRRTLAPGTAVRTIAHWFQH